jgi:hypothetical protein
VNSSGGNPSQSAPGWFGLRCLVSRYLTQGCQSEAAPNSYTGSGPRLFPTDDGNHVSDRAPETSPCHGLARQVGELDPAGDESSKATSAASRAAQGVDALPRFASAQLDVGSARGQPRKILQVRSRSLLFILGPRRGGQSNCDGVGPMTQVCRNGISVPNSLTLQHAFAPWRPSSAYSSPRRAEKCFTWYPL